MTPEQVKLVQQSFAKVAPIASTAADLFYDRLFSIAPHVRSLFPDDLTEQKKKLMQMLTVAVANLHQVEKIVPAVEDLGRRHGGYGVTATHYDPVGAALLWTGLVGAKPDWIDAAGQSGLDRNLSDGRGRDAEGRSDGPVPCRRRGRNWCAELGAIAPRSQHERRRWDGELADSESPPLSRSGLKSRYSSLKPYSGTLPELP